ncbi:hypothetical protein [Mycobacterium leprae]|nr:hypothetical protein [Mycobacterium leprae]
MYRLDLADRLVHLDDADDAPSPTGAATTMHRMIYSADDNIRMPIYLTVA